MKKISFFTLILVFMFSANCVFAKSKIVIPVGLNVPFKLTNSISSKTLSMNTKISIVVVNDVYYNDCIIFNEGTLGYMYPSYVCKARSFGKSGKINFESAYVKDANGKEQLLSVAQEIKGRKIVYGSFSFFTKSEEAEIEKSTIIYGKTITSFSFSK